MKKKIETIEIGNREFDVKNHTYVMGILNVTPDSFSDGGKYDQLDRALFHAQEMIDDGADIIDVGGESTRPGYTMISDEEEIERTVPVVEALKERFDIPISIDTYKSKVAKANIKAGVDLVNDIWGMKYDKDMAKLVADTKVACCLMHNRDEASYISRYKFLAIGAAFLTLAACKDEENRQRHHRLTISICTYKL